MVPVGVAFMILVAGVSRGSSSYIALWISRFTRLLKQWHGRQMYFEHGSVMGAGLTVAVIIRGNANRQGFEHVAGSLSLLVPSANQM